MKLTFLRAYPSLKPHISFYNNGLAIRHSFPDITHIKEHDDSLKSAILNLIGLNFFSAYPYLKPHIWFYSNGLAIWHGLSDIK